MRHDPPIPVSIRDLKARLSAHLERVAIQHETLTITNHGEPVAILRPVPTSEKDALAELRAVPGITWSGKRPDLPAPFALPTRPLGTASDKVIEDRR